MRYKIEVQDETGIWSDVRADDGKVLVYDSEQDARAALAEKFPILVQMEKYAGGKISLPAATPAMVRNSMRFSYFAPCTMRST